MRFRILGPLEVWAGGHKLNLGGVRQRRVIAALLLSPNRTVDLSRLVDVVWDERPPATARRQVQNRVAGLRALLTPIGAAIDTDPTGYRLRVGPDDLDASVFRTMVERGRAEADPTVLRRALELWRGPALAGLGGGLLAREAAHLEEQRLAALEECLDLELAAGAHSRVAAELIALVAEHPWRERLVEQLMVALYRGGRPAEALAAYRELAARLGDEMGIEPGPALRRLHEAVLRDDPGLAGTPQRTALTPSQLPGDVFGFTGRVAELARLDQLLSDRNTERAVAIAAIAGTPGAGKTALALHWAHRVRDKFADGQLYVNLRGFDPAGTAVDPAEAVRGFLSALGVPAERIPQDLAARAALYRSLLADKRVLVVLDNARDTEQVRPLLPGSAGCFTVVTSRDQLTGLVAGTGAQPLILDLFTGAEAQAFLRRRLGAGRVTAEPAAADSLIGLCARLPLALAIVAARAVSNPHFLLDALVRDLRTAQSLDAFESDDSATDVRAVFSWSYGALSPPAARMFRLLGLHPGPDIGVPAAASLAGVPARQARPLLAELARANLVTEQAPGRFSHHDLLRAYAGEQAHLVDTWPDREAALRRAYDHYLHTACGAARLMDPGRDAIALAPLPPGVTLAPIADYDDALAWFGAEHAVLLATLRQAEQTGQDRYTWRLAWSLTVYLHRCGHWHDQVTAQRGALVAAQRVGDRSWQAHAHRDLGLIQARLGHYADARRELDRALDLYRELADSDGAARTHRNTSWVCERQGRHKEALHHAQAALGLLRAAGDEAGQAYTLNDVGWYQAQLGEYRSALEHCLRALALLQRFGNRAAEAETWDSLGYIHHHLGHHGEAVDCYQRAMELFGELGDAYNQADTLTKLGETHRAAGDPGAARDAWRRALDILDRLGHPDADAVRARLDEATRPPGGTQP